MGVTLDKPWQGETFSPPTLIDIAAIENVLLARLKVAASLTDSPLSQVELAHFPDRPEAYRMTHRVGALLVRYAGPRYGKLLDTEFVVQERNLSWDCFIRTRDLGWAYGGQPSGPSPGAYGIIEAARAALAGFWI